MSEQTPQVETPVDEVVRSFLATRDVDCPGCGYNLRGVEQPVCPECGRGIELSVTRPGRARGFLFFVLLALMWVLIAGSMNGVRAWKQVRAEASQYGRTVFTFSSPSVVTGPRSPTVTLAPPTIQRRAANGQTTITIPQPPAATSSQSLTITGGGSFSFSSSSSITTFKGFAKATPNFAQVSTQTWFAFGWWAGLGLASIVGLMIAIAVRRQFDRERPPRGVVVMACTLFALYAAYHIVFFAREII